MKLHLGDFAPDKNPVAQGFAARRIAQEAEVVLTDCNWVWSPNPDTVRNLPMPTKQGAALPSRCLGAFSALVGSTPIVVLATATQLYFFNSGRLVSQGLTLTNPGNQWYFTLYGTDLIGVNGVDPAQVSANGANFAPLAGSPPVFSIIEATDFSLFGIQPNSATLNFTLNDSQWAANVATQTGQFPLTSTPGNITAARALRGGINIYKRNSFYNLQFTGPPFFWQATKVSDRVGTPGPRSVISTDTLHYFWGPDDFYATDGYSDWRVQNNLRKWFKATMDQTYDRLIYGVYDLPRSQLVWWFASKNAVPPGTYDSFVSLSLITGKWFKSTGVPIDIPVTGNVGVEQAWTWLTFENTYGFWANIPPVVWGSPIFNAGQSVDVALVDTTHHVVLLNGAWDSTIPAFITTGDLGDNVNMYRIKRVRPHFYALPGNPLDVVNPGAPLGAPPSTSATQPSVGPVANLTKCTVYSAYIEGQVPAPRTVAPLSNFGFYDFVNADRLQRLSIGWYADVELAELDVAIEYAGTQ